ncbi:RNA methyltransferase OS=Tolypothrix bouteillei VB521301 GN=DA73_05570 PE=4 SV=1: Methyltransf_26 [Gemmata massiliana]|uniref:Methyltransferase domain-containing protein n=1 Tax=Gemmata massiliana TaxID=1210884 RepID=A0A6P2DK42_9BACT|nr:TIGR03000 domain-containing protein [Gemmata massiliana]VTS00889.1 RNA methyltransferase OS=Tolypothrix bouteillei VB521301 GN=DA73_05570 PE=4 SV=1: Methyltransf_26 [Gemmata massiliana]
MFTRTARMFGFTLALFTVTAGLTALSVSAQPDKKEEKKDSKKVKSKIKITVPQDDAKLKIEDKDTKPTGVTREFETPDLEAGKLYEYTFSVTWQPNNYTTLTRTKSIEFKGGDDIVADLTKVDPKAPDKAVIRWVPTPDDIVEEMLKLGKVGKDDVVYEPGPGDGRMLIAAVKKGAKKGVGIELDPKKAEEAKDAVKKAKLDKEITIIEGDALKDRDYSEATVVLLYMGNEFNNLLRPVLEKQLKPGSRIISHRFVLGDWAPDKTIKVTGADGEEYVLHVWTVKEKSKK